MSVFALFFGAAAIKILAAYLGRYVATAFVSADVARVAGFAFAIGVAGISVRGPIQSLSIAAGLGELFGLVAAWWLFFRWKRVYD